MTAYTPTSELGKAMLHLRHMVALSATFQEAVGGEYAVAFERVFYEGIPGGTLLEAYALPPLDLSLPCASIWPRTLRFVMPCPDLVREVGDIHLYLRWPTNLRLPTWNDRVLQPFDKLQKWTREICELSSRADDGEHGPIISGESHLAIQMSEGFNEHTPLEMRPPGLSEIQAAQAGHQDFQFRHLVITIGDGAESGGG